MKIASLTCKEVNPDTTVDDYLAFELLRAQGHSIDELIWDSPQNWEEYDLVIVRTTWDYMEKLELFHKVLAEIDSKTKLINPLETLIWNSNKKYLLELGEIGIPTIPSLLREKIERSEIASLLSDPKYSDGIVIKPCVGASSIGIQFIKDVSDFKEVQKGEWFIQPLQPKIQEVGEHSLFFFEGKFSHAICKLPKQGEFRCQEEYGSNISNWSPTKEAIQVASRVFTELKHPINYARVDLLQDNNGNYQVIEVELIEPCLYLSTSTDAPGNYAKMVRGLLK